MSQLPKDDSNVERVPLRTDKKKKLSRRMIRCVCGEIFHLSLKKCPHCHAKNTLKTTPEEDEANRTPNIIELKSPHPKRCKDNCVIL